MPSVWNEILYHFDLALSICSKIPLFHTRKPKNKLSSKSASSPKVLTLVLGWKISPVTRCPHTLAVGVHPPGGGTAPAKGREGSVQTPSQGTNKPPWFLCSSFLWGKCCTCTPLLQSSSRGVCGNTGILVSKGFGGSRLRFPSEAQSSSSDLPRCRKGARGSAGKEPESGQVQLWAWPLQCSHWTLNWLLWEKRHYKNSILYDLI